MSLLRDSIRHLSGRAAPGIRLRDEPLVEGAADRVRDADGVAKISAQDLDAVAATVITRLTAHHPLSNKELRQAPWCLWNTNPALAHDESSLNGLLQQVEASQRRPPGRALASSYVYSYAADRVGLAAVSESLSRLSNRLGRPWTELHEKFFFFNCEEGPRRVASQALTERIPPTELLRRNGVSGQGSQSGYAIACAAELLKQLAAKDDVAAADRLAIVEKIALSSQRKLVFQAHGRLVADALLLPFATKMPSKEIRDQYLSLLLDLFKDPRLPGNGWGGMPKARDIAVAWLTEQSLRQFLDIVDRLAVEHMWAPRRAFWETAYRAGLILEAWVVFDHAGATAARQAFGKAVGFATFDGGVQYGQAVLLLRVGRGVVAEWSHNGKCNIWTDADDRKAPRLYRSTYPAFNLRSHGDSSINRSTFAVSHMSHWGPGSWQLKVAAKLHQMTGIRLRPAEWERWS